MTPEQTPRIIGISGKQFSGKDLLADLLAETLPGGFVKIPLALAIKQAYGAQHGLTLAEIEADKPTHRPGLIALGDWGRAQDPDYWLKQVLEKPGNKIISDVRLKREYELLRERESFLIRVEADRAIRAERGQLVSETDPTECDLDEISGWDALIRNDGTLDDLKAQLASIYNRFST